MFISLSEIRHSARLVCNNNELREIIKLEGYEPRTMPGATTKEERQMLREQLDEIWEAAPTRGGGSMNADNIAHYHSEQRGKHRYVDEDTEAAVARSIAGHKREAERRAAWYAAQRAEVERIRKERGWPVGGIEDY